MKSPAVKSLAVVVVLLAAVTWAKARNTANIVEGNQSVATIGGGGGVAGGTADGGDLHAEALEGFSVNRTDEPGADDPGAQSVKWLHATE